MSKSKSKVIAFIEISDSDSDDEVQVVPRAVPERKPIFIDLSNKKNDKRQQKTIQEIQPEQKISKDENVLNSPTRSSALKSDTSWSVSIEEISKKSAIPKENNLIRNITSLGEDDRGTSSSNSICNPNKTTTSLQDHPYLETKSGFDSVFPGQANPGNNESYAPEVPTTTSAVFEAGQLNNKQEETRVIYEDETDAKSKLPDASSRSTPTVMNEQDTKGSEIETPKEAKAKRKRSKRNPTPTPLITSSTDLGIQTLNAVGIESTPVKETTPLMHQPPKVPRKKRRKDDDLVRHPFCLTIDECFNFNQNDDSSSSQPFTVTLDLLMKPPEVVSLRPSRKKKPIKSKSSSVDSSDPLSHIWNTNRILAFS